MDHLGGGSSKSMNEFMILHTHASDDTFAHRLLPVYLCVFGFYFCKTNSLWVDSGLWIDLSLDVFVNVESKMLML